MKRTPDRTPFPLPPTVKSAIFPLQTVYLKTQGNLNMVPTTTSIKMVAFWDVTPFSLIDTLSLRELTASVIRAISHSNLLNFNNA